MKSMTPKHLMWLKRGAGALAFFALAPPVLNTAEAFILTVAPIVFVVGIGALVYQYYKS